MNSYKSTVEKALDVGVKHLTSNESERLLKDLSQEYLHLTPKQRADLLLDIYANLKWNSYIRLLASPIADIRKETEIALESDSEAKKAFERCSDVLGEVDQDLLFKFSIILEPNALYSARLLKSRYSAVRSIGRTLFEEHLLAAKLHEDTGYGALYSIRGEDIFTFAPNCVDQFIELNEAKFITPEVKNLYGVKCLLVVAKSLPQVVYGTFNTEGVFKTPERIPFLGSGVILRPQNSPFYEEKAKNFIKKIVGSEVNSFRATVSFVITEKGLSIIMRPVSDNIIPISKKTNTLVDKVRGAA